MIRKRIIPCLDVTQGRVVKGTNFVNLRDAGDPVELAQEYNRQGADELVFLDITASSDKRKILKDLVARTAEVVFIPFTVGGGINDINTMHELLQAGADKVSVNSAAVNTPELIQKASDTFGSQCIVVAIDARKVSDEQSSPAPQYTRVPEVQLTKDSQWEVYTHGGRQRTGIDAIKWANYMAQLGAGEILLTSMDADGTKAGYDLALTSAVNEAVSIPIIASGGAGNCQHIVDVLKSSDAALLASLLHFRELTVEQIKTECRKNNLSIR